MTGEKPTILVVDDNVEITDLLKIRLEQGGYKVMVAPDGKTALSYLNDGHDISAMIIDFMMPDMNGLDVLKHVRRDPRHKGMYVAVATACARTPERREEAITAGADEYIIKPFDFSGLVSRVKKGVERCYQNMPKG